MPEGHSPLKSLAATLGAACLLIVSLVGCGLTAKQKLALQIKLARLPFNGASSGRANHEAQTSLALATQEPRTRPYPQGRRVRRAARRRGR